VVPSVLQTPKEDCFWKSHYILLSLRSDKKALLLLLYMGLYSIRSACVESLKTVGTRAPLSRIILFLLQRDKPLKSKCPERPQEYQSGLIRSSRSKPSSGFRPLCETLKLISLSEDLLCTPAHSQSSRKR
jgi:hypothetical protein